MNQANALLTDAVVCGTPRPIRGAIHAGHVADAAPCCSTTRRVALRCLHSRIAFSSLSSPPSIVVDHGQRGGAQPGRAGETGDVAGRPGGRAAAPRLHSTG